MTEAVAEARIIAAFNRLIEAQRSATLDDDVSRLATTLGTSAMLQRLRALRDEADDSHG